MFSKKNRADKKAIDEIFKKGLFIGVKGINLKFFIKKGLNSHKIAILVPKTSEKKAVRRNYLRRRGYLILKKHLNLIPEGFFGAFILNKPANLFSKEQTEEVFKEILKKIRK